MGQVQANPEKRSSFPKSNNRHKTHQTQYNGMETETIPYTSPLDELVNAITKKTEVYKNVYMYKGDGFTYLFKISEILIMACEPEEMKKRARKMDPMDAEKLINAREESLLSVMKNRIKEFVYNGQVGECEDPDMLYVSINDYKLPPLIQRLSKLRPNNKIFKEWYQVYTTAVSKQ